jgi:hypothetical protein
LRNLNEYSSRYTWSNIRVKLDRYFRNGDKLFLDVLKIRLFRIIPDKLYLKLKYRIILRRKLSFSTPRTFNEKIQYLKLHQKDSLYSIISDKYLVRQYISEKIGEKYLIPLHGVFNKVEDIDYDKLPEQYVLKCNHDSGTVILCDDQNTQDIIHNSRILNKALNINYYYQHREHCYKNIQPRVLCEALLKSETEKQIMDYKIMCFNGKAKCLFLTRDRLASTGLKLNFYDLNMEKLPFRRVYQNFTDSIVVPSNIDEMISIAEKLAKDFTFIRVDLYSIDSRIYFGELTLYPGSGFEAFDPEEYDYKLGSWINLPMTI